MDHLNELIRESNLAKQRDGKGPVRPKLTKDVSDSEFWIWWGLILVARVYGKKGDIWMKQQPDGIEPIVDFTRHIAKHCHKEIKSFMHLIFADRSIEKEDPWWRISRGIQYFNDNRHTKIWSSYIKVFDESILLFNVQLN